MKALQNIKGIQGQIITIVTPLAQEIAQRQAEFMQKTDVVVTDSDIEAMELGAVVDLFKAITKYLMATDTLVSMEVFSGITGVEIKSIIARDGEEFEFNTNAIWAGGYNIQREHLRYLINTNLPKVSNTDFSKEVIDAHKKMTKVQKLEKELNDMKARMSKNEDIIASAKVATDAQIADEILATNKDAAWYWDEYTSDMKISKQEFTAMVEEGKKRLIEFWKQKNIEWKLKENKAIAKAIAKQEAKIETLK